MSLRGRVAAGVLAAGLAIGAPALAGAPPAAGEPGLPATESWIYAAVTVPYAAMSAAAGRALPESFDGQGREPLCLGGHGDGSPLAALLGRAADLLGRLGGQGRDGAACEEVAVSYHAERTGPVSFAPDGGRLRVEVPLSISGEIGLEGRLAHALRLERKPFAGALVAYAEIALSLGSDWCPVIEARPGYRWTDRARLEIARGVAVPVDRLAAARIDQAVRDGVRRLQGQLRCADLRRAAAAAWHGYDLPIEPPGGPALVLSIRPRRAGVSPVRFGPAGAAFELGLAAGLSVGDAPAPPASTALPALQALSPAARPSALAVPLRVGYDALEARLAAALGGRDWGGDTAAGHISLTVGAVDLHPAAAGRLAVGLRVKAVTPDPALNGDGWIRLTARPVLDTRGQVLRLAEAGLDAAVGNPLWNGLSALLRRQLQDAIEQRAALPLGKPLGRLQQRLRADLAAFAARNGLAITLGALAVTPRQVRLSGSAVEMLLGVDATIGVVVERIPGLPAG